MFPSPYPTVIRWANGPILRLRAGVKQTLEMFTRAFPDLRSLPFRLPQKAWRRLNAGPGAKGHRCRHHLWPSARPRSTPAVTDSHARCCTTSLTHDDAGLGSVTPRAVIGPFDPSGPRPVASPASTTGRDASRRGASASSTPEDHPQLPRSLACHPHRLPRLVAIGGSDHYVVGVTDHRETGPGHPRVKPASTRLAHSGDSGEP